MHTRNIRIGLAVLLFLALLFACYATGGVITIDLAGAQAATPFVVPEGYSVRVREYGELTAIFMIPPADEEPDRALYYLWGIVHQAQARRIDAQANRCRLLGDLTVDCDYSIVTFGSERGQRTTDLKIPRRDRERSN